MAPAGFKFTRRADPGFLIGDAYRTRPLEVQLRSVQSPYCSGRAATGSTAVGRNAIDQLAEDQFAFGGCMHLGRTTFFASPTISQDRMIHHDMSYSHQRCP